MISTTPSRLLCVPMICLSLVLTGSAYAQTVYVDQVAPGWNATDATDAINNALKSGAKIIVLRKQRGPWIVREEIVLNQPGITFKLEAGVVLQAKRGAFKGITERVLRINRDNITVSGYGATIKMWKQDYQDPSQYKPSEWRHCVSVGGVKNFVIEGLTLRDSGGDGIYLSDAWTALPYCSGKIRDVVCDNNHRQGISIISAQNVLIENSVFKNTSGTNPASGVDIEPNHAYNKLKNIVFRNCRFERNARFDIKVALWHYHGSEVEDVSITFDNCTTNGGGKSAVQVQALDDGFYDGPGGFVKFKNCTFKNSKESGLFIRNDVMSSDQVFATIFDQCRIINCGTKGNEAYPIELYNTIEPGGIANLAFKNCRVEDTKDRPVVSGNYFVKQHGVTDVSGTIAVKSSYEPRLDIGDKLTNVTLKLVKERPSPPTGGNGKGISYAYYEGNWTSLPNFSQLTPLKEGTVDNITLAPRRRNDNFGFLFYGYITIEKEGEYTFYTRSDDGSRMFVDGEWIVNNNGLHSVREASGTKYLTKGRKIVRVIYFDRTGKEELGISYRGPGIAKQAIPTRVLSPYRTRSSTVATLPEGNQPVIFPNPAVDEFTVRFTDTDLDLQQPVTLRNSRGNVVDSFNPKQATGRTFTMKVAQIPSGTYYLSYVDQGGLLHTQPIVLER